MTSTIQERIDAATSSTNKWNNWPDFMELVRIEHYDLRDPEKAYIAGKLMGSSQTMRQIRSEAFPIELAPPYKGITSVHFTYAYDKGQMDSIETRNIFAMIEYRVPGLANRLELIVAEIGCKHRYDTTGSRNCLSVGTCQKCGHKFLCDSGD